MLKNIVLALILLIKELNEIVRAQLLRGFPTPLLRFRWVHWSKVSGKGLDLCGSNGHIIGIWMTPILCACDFTFCVCRCAVCVSLFEYIQLIQKLIQYLRRIRTACLPLQEFKLILKYPRWLRLLKPYYYCLLMKVLHRRRGKYHHTKKSMRQLEMNILN